VQRAIEMAGISTITLSSIPDLTRAVGVPRLAAIEYPLGRPFGLSGDVAGQMAVLRATLNAIPALATPGAIVQLPFEWPEPVRQAIAHPPEPPPIAKYLKRHPWALPKLFSRDVPEAMARPA
jgi:hypothetical protein